MIRRPPRSTLDRSSAASDVYKRQPLGGLVMSRTRWTLLSLAVFALGSTKVASAQGTITGRITAEGNLPLADRPSDRGQYHGLRYDERRRQVHPQGRSFRDLRHPGPPRRVSVAKENCDDDSGCCDHG